MKPPRVLLFDVFGTLVDWRSSLINIAVTTAARCGAHADWAAVIDDWRRAYQPAMDEVRGGAGRGGTWTRCSARRWPRCWAGAGSACPPTAGRSWWRAGASCGPGRTAGPGWTGCAARHVTATLSNGHLALLADLLKFADLRLDVVLSAQLADGYKPDPQVYLTALRLLDCPPAEAAMVAAHPSDLRAAAALGLRPAYMARPREWGPGAVAPPAPDLDGLIEADSLTGLATILGC